jgi:hypothetical protein
MKARRFTDQGLAAFSEYVAAARVDSKARVEVAPLPDKLLWTADFATETSFELPDAEPVFDSKFAIGEFVSGIVPEWAYEEVRTDAGFWTWLAARYFDQITGGRKKIKEGRAYVAGLSFQEFYRHLILGPYYLYFTARHDPERVRVLLYDEPTTMNEVMVQFGSYQTLMQNKELQAVIQRLYFDPARQRIKRGAGGKGAGTPRRLMDYFRQIELNYDLNSVTEAQFWSMLPREFEKFKQQ